MESFSGLRIGFSLHVHRARERLDGAQRVRGFNLDTEAQFS